MLTQKRIIAYELNEVPARVLEFYTALRPQSAIASIINRSAYFDTYTPDTGHLSPWSTWPTQHRGVNNEHHGISDLGQDLTDVDREYPPIWSILARNSVRTGLFGSLNSYPLPQDLSNYAFYVPDTFAAGSECFPGDLSVFQEFNLRMVDLSSRVVSSSIALKPAFDLMRRAPHLGVRGATVLRLTKHLAHERVNRLRKGRRRTIQAELAFDLFLKQLRKTKPEYSSFFTNHVASSMHRYWPAIFPGDYHEKKLSKEWMRNFGGEILYTMDTASRHIGQLADFVDRNRNENYVLMVSTSMGQAAVDNNEIVRKNLLIYDFRLFMDALGFAPDQWSKRRAMMPQYVFAVNEQVAPLVRERLDAIWVNGKTITYVEHEGNVFMVELGFTNLEDDEIDVRFGGKAVDYRKLGMRNITIEDETGAYAYHIPEGLMFIHDPSDLTNANRSKTTMSTTEITPLILKNFGVDVPAYMGQ